MRLLRARRSASPPATLRAARDDGAGRRGAHVASGGRGWRGGPSEAAAVCDRARPARACPSGACPGAVWTGAPRTGLVSPRLELGRTWHPVGVVGGAGRARPLPYAAEGDPPARAPPEHVGQRVRLQAPRPRTGHSAAKSVRDGANRATGANARTPRREHPAVALLHGLPERRVFACRRRSSGDPGRLRRHGRRRAARCGHACRITPGVRLA